MRKLILIPACLAAFSVQAGLGKMDRSVTQHKEFALQQKFDFACQLNAGSATVIDPFWVITANHVSNSKSEGNNVLTCASYEKDQHGVYQQIKRQVVTSNSTSEYGEYEFTDGVYDFALVRFDTPIMNIEPAKLPKKDMFSYDETYQVNQVGFGNYNGRNGGTKEVRYNHTDRKWLAESNLAPSIMKETDLHWVAIHGDSGSGITIEHENEFYLLGEIGLQYYGELGWQDTFDDVIQRVDWIQKLMKEHGFSYAEPVALTTVMWDANSHKNISNAQAYYSAWTAHNMDFNQTYWRKDGGIVNTAYVQAGDRYTFETVIPKKPEMPAFDLYVNSRIVAHNIKADKQSLKLTVNAFTNQSDQLVIEFKPLVANGTKIVIDHFLVKKAKP